MNKIAIAGPAGDDNNKRNGNWIGTVKEFPEIKIVGTTKLAVFARIDFHVKKALSKMIAERRARGEKGPFGKMKVTIAVRKIEK